jgi:hypothetical protein
MWAPLTLLTYWVYICFITIGATAQPVAEDLALDKRDIPVPEFREFVSKIYIPFTSTEEYGVRVIFVARAGGLTWFWDTNAWLQGAGDQRTVAYRLIGTHVRQQLDDGGHRFFGIRGDGPYINPETGETGFNADEDQFGSGPDHLFVPAVYPRWQNSAITILSNGARVVLENPVQIAYSVFNCPGNCQFN